MSHRFPLKEIAFQAGLSLATVDRAIHRRRHVRQSTIDRVELAIRELERQYANVSAKGRRFIIDIVVHAPSRFTTAIRDAFEAEFPAMRPASFGARFHFAQTMSDADIQQIIRAIRRRGSHGVLVKLPNTDCTNLVTSQLMDARIPVVSYVTDIRSENRIGYVGMDNRRAGATAAFLIGKMLSDRPARILLTLSSSLFEGEEQREMGFRETITALYPHLKTVTISEGMGVSGATHGLVVSALEKHTDIAAVYSIGGANRAVISAFADAGRQCRVFAAHDLDETNRELLRRQQIDFVLHHDFRQDARRLCQMFLAYHRLAADWSPQARSPIGISTPVDFEWQKYPLSRT